MKLEVKDNCPIIRAPCKKFDCAWFTEIRGQNPQTGEDASEWNCAINMIPLLLLENGRQTHHTGAAIESFRNEMVKANETSTELMVAAAEGRAPKLIEG